MLTDFRDCEDGLSFHADVCVVGAGAAGITVARALLGSGRTVCLVESGGVDFEPETQALYRGATEGQPYYDLEDARLRFFGGTTAIWGGRCMPLDPIDFQRRDWVPDSGWPFGPEALAPYYEQVRAALDLPFPRFDAGLAETLRLPAPPVDRQRLEAAYWQFDGAYWRFRMENCRDLTEHPDVRVLLHANVVDIHTDALGRHVDRIVIARHGAVRGTVRARVFVLACGGIENPRLLLAARGACPDGLGNAHGNVGRYFMEHPRARLGTLESDQAFQVWDALRKRFVGGRKVMAALRLSDAEQARRQVLNAGVTAKYQRRESADRPIMRILYDTVRDHSPPNRRMRQVWRLYNRANDLLQGQKTRALRHFQFRHGRGRVLFMVRGEQAPNPDSRVVLDADDRDALGMPRARLIWRLSEIDKRTAAAFTEVLDAELRRAGLGRLEPAGWLREPGTDWPVDPALSKHALGGYHHMGTTRMAESPQRGVVDPDCRVHGLDNLYIAGSSVFPTGGWSNPTMTILALSLRLGEHLRTRTEPVPRIATPATTPTKTLA